MLAPISKKAIFYITTLICASPMHAIVTGNWISTGDANWNNSSNWMITSPNTPPNSFPGQTTSGGDQATFNTQIPPRPVFSTSPITLGVLNCNFTPGTTQALEPNPMIFSNINSSPALLNVRTGGLNFSSPSIVLQSNLEVNVLPATIGLNQLILNDALSGPGGITFNLASLGANLRGSNTNTGTYTVNSGVLLVNPLSPVGVSFPSDLVINTGGTVRLFMAFANNRFATTSNVTLNGGTLDLNGSSAQEFNSLTVLRNGRVIEGGTLARLTLLSSDVALRIKGGMFAIQTLRLENGGSITYDPDLGGDGSAVIGVPIGIDFHPTLIDLNGHNVKVAVNDGTMAPADLFDLAFLNTIFIDGSLTKTLSGTLLFDGNNSIPSLSILGGRVLFGRTPTDVTLINNNTVSVNPGTTLGGFGMLGDTGSTVVTNSGTVAPGSTTQTGTLTISGSYTQTASGTLFIKTAGQNTDLLKVIGGGVNLNGALVVQGVGSNFRPGDRVVIVDNNQGTGITGTFARFRENLANDVLVKFVVDPKEVALVFFTSPEPEIGGVETSVITLINGHNLNTLSRLRAVRNRFGTRVWGERPALQTESQHPRETIPFKARHRDFAVNDDAEITEGEHPKKDIPLRVRRRDFAANEETQITAGRFWNKPSDQPASIYVAPLGSWGNVGSIGVQEGFDYNSVGGLLGADYAFQKAGIGALVGYEGVHGTVDNCFGTFHFDSAFGQLYGTFLPLANRNFFLDLIAGGSRNWYTLNRQSTCAIAKGKPKGWEYDGYAGLGYDINMKKEWRLTPIAGIQYVHLKIDHFLEEGAFDENLFVAAQKMRSLRSWAGASFGGKLERHRVTWMPEIRGFWQHEFAKLSHCVNVTSFCHEFCEGIQIFTGNRNYGIVGAELRALFGPRKRWTLAGAYDYYWSHGTHINYLYGELGVNF